MKLQPPSTKDRPAVLLQWLKLGAQLHMQDRLSEAEVYYLAILKSQPTHLQAQQLLGALRLQMGQPDEAVKLFQRVLKANPNVASVHADLGNALVKLDRRQDALASYDRAIGLKADRADTFCNRAVLLNEFGRSGEALSSCDAALVINPGYAEAHYSRAIALKALKRHEEALLSYGEAIRLKPDYAQAFNNCGEIHFNLSRYEAALVEFDQAIAIDPHFADAYYNRGNALAELQRTEEAIAAYDQALELNPGLKTALYNRSLQFLLLGDLAAGWKDYDMRFEQPDSPPRRLTLPCPSWAGQPIAGKRLIIYDEQGIGDLIQVARYLPLVAALEADVTVFVPQRTRRLIGPLAAGLRLAEEAPEIPFDYQCPSMSLPAVFHTTLDTIPQTSPYLVPEPDRVTRWRQRIGDHGIRIGIAWQGNPAGRVDIGRSIPLLHFRRLADIPGVRLISLQKNEGAEQLAHLAGNHPIETLGHDLDAGDDAFVDTAAVMASLDLVITSDTAIAHLAGALGRPVWVALKHVPDWRWMLNRRDSPWYPTMRLYRQEIRGDWAGVFDRIAADLVGHSGSFKPPPLGTGSIS